MSSDAVRHNFERLEQTHWDPDPPVVSLAPLLERLPYLVGPIGALCAFRLPLLPADGLPGVKVGAEIKPSKDQTGLAATGTAAPSQGSA